MGFLRLLWTRPAILVIGLAIGVFIGLNLMPDIGGPGVAPSAAPANSSAPAVKTAAVAKTSAASGKGAPALLIAATPASPDVRIQLAKLATAGRPLTVGIFGDSLGDGIWAAMYRDLHSDKGFNVVRLSQVSTGLSRYNYVDVQQKTVGQLATQHIDIAVFMFGANDQQGIVEDNKIYPFGTDGWKAAYGRRVDNLVNTLRQQGAVIYWVGLPKMESHHFDDGAQLINAVLAQHMAALGAEFIPTVAITSDENGDYSAYLTIGASKTKTLMRANDGIHMSMAGYLRLTAPVAAAIRRDLAAAAPVMAPAATPIATTPVTAPGAPPLVISGADAHP
jgi:hypothetical protein